MKLNLNQKLANIQAKLKAKKSRYNGFGKYHYRAAEDILEAIKPFLLEHKVTVTVSEEMVSIDPPIIKTTASIFDGDSDFAIQLPVLSVLIYCLRVCQCLKNTVQLRLMVKNML